MNEIEGEKIPTVSIHDLLSLKQKSGRKQDFTDVEYLNDSREIMENQRKGFSYTVSREQLEDYRTWPVERRLKWLYFANRIRRSLPQKTVEIQKLFHNGKS